jgi:hypothetical protein
LAIDHYVDQIAGLDLDTAVGLAELFDGNEALGLVSEVDDDVSIVKFYNAALEQFAFMRRREMAIVFDELLVVRFFGGHV